MKKVLAIFSLFMIVFALFISSCSNDLTTVPPSISVKGRDGDIYKAGETVQFTIQFKSFAMLKNYNITNSLTGITTEIISRDSVTLASNNTFKTNVYSSTLFYKVVIPANYGGEKFTIKFEIFDIEASNELIISLPNGTLMADEFKNGIIYSRIYSSGTYAWDLTSNTALTPSEITAAKGDMVNITSVQSVSTDTDGYGFVVGWDGVNSTDFVKTTANSNATFYASATIESVKATYTAGTKSTSIKHAQVNDLYIAKIKGTDTYALIMITEIYQTQKTKSLNDYIKFKYKKGTLSSK